MKRILTVIVLSFALTGCSLYQIDSRSASTKYYPPKKSSSDVVYVEKSDKPFEVIGEVVVTTERRQTLESVIPKMMYEAAILGGDAITDIQTDASGAWKNIKPKALLGNAYIRANYSAKVIVFTAGAAASASASEQVAAPVQEKLSLPEVSSDVQTEEVPAPSSPAN